MTFSVFCWKLARIKAELRKLREENKNRGDRIVY